jgi:hypothetical protein
MLVPAIANPRQDPRMPSGTDSHSRTSPKIHTTALLAPWMTRAMHCQKPKEQSSEQVNLL